MLTVSAFGIGTALLLDNTSTATLNCWPVLGLHLLLADTISASTLLMMDGRFYPSVIQWESRWQFTPFRHELARQTVSVAG